MALTKERNDAFEREGRERLLPVAEDAVIYAGAAVCLDSDGYAVPASTATGLRSAGRAEETVDNTGGTDGAKNVRVRTGIFNYASAGGGDAISADDIGKTCYWVDDQTVALTSAGGTRSIAGPIFAADEDGVWVVLADRLTLTDDAATITGALDVGAAATVGGDLTVGGDATFEGDVAFEGEVVGVPCVVGPFVAPGAAGAIAATQTDLDMRYAHDVSAIATGWVAPRAGSIIGLSAQLSGAVSGEGGTVTVAAVKNGTEVALEVEFTTAGAETALAATEDAGVLTFEAGDVLQLSYTSADTSNTPSLVGSLLVTQ